MISLGAVLVWKIKFYAPNDKSHAMLFQGFYGLLDLFRPGVIGGSQERHPCRIPQPEQKVNIRKTGLQ